MSTFFRASMAQPAPGPPSGTLPDPDARGPEFSKAKPRSWRVVHASEYARDVLPVVDAQAMAGMRPYLVTPLGAGTPEMYLAGEHAEQRRALSLLRLWQDVRVWRKSLLECDPENRADIVHSHSFASGMAAVRSFSCVAYDPAGCIEELAISAGQCEPGSWMGRSFRVAEQFILLRAEAVIVHSQGMKAAMEERGAPPENVFVIPEPIDLEARGPLLSGSFPGQHFGLENATFTCFVPWFARELGEDLSGPTLAVLEAYARVAAELPRSKLLLEAPDAAVAALQGQAQKLGLVRSIGFVAPADAPRVMEGADVVIATGDVPRDPVAARETNEICLKSMAMGKPLLAADVPRNREASPEGRGCLWFQWGDVRDLGSRLAFLGRHPEFRAALAAAGRAHIAATRSPAAVAEKYGQAYRHAFSRKRTGGYGPNLGGLERVPANG